MPESLKQSEKTKRERRLYDEHTFGGSKIY